MMLGIMALYSGLINLRHLIRNKGCQNPVVEFGLAAYLSIGALVLNFIAVLIFLLVGSTITIEVSQLETGGTVSST